MIGFVLRRVLAMVPLLLAVTLLTHLLVEWAPGDVLSELALDPSISRETLNELRHKFHLDQGTMARYGAWLRQALTGDLGVAANGEPVARLIGERLVNTLALAGAAFLIAWLIGVPLGIVAALERGTWIDRGCGLIAYASISTPVVFLSLLLAAIAARTGWFPIGMAESLDHDRMPLWSRVLDSLHHLALPALALGTFTIAWIMRQMRGAMLEILQQDFLRTARAKGLPERVVVGKHALRNALNPMITLFGHSIGALLNGSFLVEFVFSWPGMARLTYDGLMRQDEFLVKGSVVIASAMLLFGNTLADVLLGAADPRVRVA